MKIVERLAVIETKISNIEAKMGDIEKAVKEIRNNHITEIYEQLRGMEVKLFKRLPYWVVLMLAGLASFVTALIGLAL